MNIFNLNQIYSTFVEFLFLNSGLIARFIFDGSSILFFMYWNTFSFLFFIVTIFYSIFITLSIFFLSFYPSSFLSIFLSILLPFFLFFFLIFYLPFFLSFFLSFLSLICNISNTFFVNEFCYADMAPEIVQRMEYEGTYGHQVKGN